MAKNRERYKAMLKKYDLQRPTFRFTLPTGLEVTAQKIETFEFLKICEILGVNPEVFSEDDPKNKLGFKLMAKAKELLDQFVVKYVVDPRLLPSTATEAERDADQEAIPMDEIHPIDQQELINMIMSSGSGKEGRAKAETFPEDAAGKADRATG